jgi:HEPN domain-containing protein
MCVAAEWDQQAFGKPEEDPSLHDARVGFQARQAVEQPLKAVLAQAAAVFHRTYDTAELLDLPEDAGISAPPHVAHADELNPDAVEMLYGPIEPSGLDRSRTALPVV